MEYFPSIVLVLFSVLVQLALSYLGQMSEELCMTDVTHISARTILTELLQTTLNISVVGKLNTSPNFTGQQLQL